MTSLKGMGHVLRIGNCRITKHMTLAWPASEITKWRKRKTQTTISFWRQILRNADLDQDIVEMKVHDKTFKKP